MGVFLVVPQSVYGKTSCVSEMWLIAKRNFDRIRPEEVKSLRYLRYEPDQTDGMSIVVDAFLYTAVALRNRFVQQSKLKVTGVNEKQYILC